MRIPQPRFLWLVSPLPLVCTLLPKQVDVLYIVYKWSNHLKYLRFCQNPVCRFLRCSLGVIEHSFGFPHSPVRISSPEKAKTALRVPTNLGTTLLCTG